MTDWRGGYNEHEQGDKMPDNEKRRYFEVSPELGDGCSKSIVPDVDLLLQAVKLWAEEFKDTKGESFSVSVVEMTPQQVEALPEL